MVKFFQFLKTRRWLLALGVALLLGGVVLCYVARPVGRSWRLRPLAPTERIELSAADLVVERLARALRLNLKYLEKLPPERQLTVGTDSFAVGRLRSALAGLLRFLEALPAPTAGEVSAYLAAHFRLCEVNLSRRGFPWFGDRPRPVLFTGYYVPTLNGALRPDARFRYPLYRRPADLVTVELRRFGLRERVRRIWPWLDHLPLIPGLNQLTFPRLRGRLTPDRKVVPYYTREEIDYQQKLSGRGLELVWVDDDSDRFFLQIQGSGRIRLPDGKILMVGYAASNGRPYRSIGGWLIRHGELRREEVSMPAIRRWLERHPERRQEIFSYNPSYVFFRKLEIPEPLGCLQLPLTPGVSIAADRRIYPGGLPALVELELPRFSASGEPAGSRPCRRLALIQDTGGAIRGPGRIDLFCGADATAALTAGHLKARGRLILLLPREL